MVPLSVSLHPSVASTTCGQIERSPSTPRRVSYLERQAWTSPSVVMFYFRNFSRTVGLDLKSKPSLCLPSHHRAFCRAICSGHIWPSDTPPFTSSAGPSLCALKLPATLPIAGRQLAEAKPALMGHSPVLSLRLCTQNCSHFMTPLPSSAAQPSKAWITLL